MNQRETIDLASVPADESQKNYWQGVFEKESVALARKKELEDAKEKLKDQKPKVQADLIRSEDLLSQKILLWATGKKAYRLVTECRQKVSELREQLSDIEEGLRRIETAVAKETNVPISHGSTARGQIQYLVDKKRDKDAENGK